GVVDALLALGARNASDAAAEARLRVHADATAVGTAVLRIAVVVGVVDALLAVGALDARDAAAKLRRRGLALAVVQHAGARGRGVARVAVGVAVAAAHG